MPYLKNAWYVAAWADDVVVDALLPRRLLDEPVLLWRQKSGQVVALADRCPQRFAPLHIGRVVEAGSTCREGTSVQRASPAMKPTHLRVRVAKKQPEAIDICSLELEDLGGHPLSPFAAGSHIDGVPDHRDSCLTPEEQALNDQFTPCCSRSVTSQLALDL